MLPSLSFSLHFTAGSLLLSLPLSTSPSSPSSSKVAARRSIVVSILSPSSSSPAQQHWQQPCTPPNPCRRSRRLPRPVSPRGPPPRIPPPLALSRKPPLDPELDGGVERLDASGQRTHRASGGSHLLSTMILCGWSQTVFPSHATQGRCGSLFAPILQPTPSSETSDVLATPWTIYPSTSCSFLKSARYTHCMSRNRCVANRIPGRIVNTIGA